VVAVAHGRRRVLVRDLPVAGRPVVLAWSKRVCRCCEPDCEKKTWSEGSTMIAPRAVLTERARAEICRRVGAEEYSVAAMARESATTARHCSTTPGVLLVSTPWVSMRPRSCTPGPGGAPSTGRSTSEGVGEWVRRMAPNRAVVSPRPMVQLTQGTDVPQIPRAIVAIGKLACRARQTKAVRSTIRALETIPHTCIASPRLPSPHPSLEPEALPVLRSLGA
jgi:zinc-finger of transposase IS204/IS1001/IS1096/IS1165